jgi:hypothetical protein
MDCTEKIFHALGWQDILYAHRDNRNASAHRPLDLAVDLAGFISTRRKDKNHDATSLDGVDYGSAIFHAGPDIARSDPAANSSTFEQGTRGVGGCLVPTRRTDECIKFHHVNAFQNLACRLKRPEEAARQL